jgi:uncharacterized membrane protein
MSPTGAFISVLVFLFFPGTFLETAVVARQMVAELIMVLLFWLIASAEFRRTRFQAVLVILMTVGLVISHYSVALIYIFLIGFSLLAAKIVPKFRRARLMGNINLLALSLVAALAWFLFTAGGIVLGNFTASLWGVITDLTNFFHPTGRPLEVYQALGVTEVNYSVIHLVNRGVQYMVPVCITIGFVVYLLKKPGNSGEKALGLLIPASMCFLIAAVVLPNLAAILNISRIYSITLLLLSPCFYFGADSIMNCFWRTLAFLTREPRKIRIPRGLPAVILFLYLIFASGWMWAVTLDTPTSLVLDSQRIASSPEHVLEVPYYIYYTLPQDVAAAQWIGSETSLSTLEICADLNSQKDLASYAGYETNGPLSILHGGRLEGCKLNDYVYVSVMNFVTGLVAAPSAAGPSISESTLSYYVAEMNGTILTLSGENRIYSDGAAIYSPQR